MEPRRGRIRPSPPATPARHTEKEEEKKMKKCILLTLFLVVLASLCSTAVADIPSDVDYYVHWNKSDSMWHWYWDHYNYGLPWWEPSYYRLHIPNMQVPNATKEVWVEATYYGGIPGTWQPFTLVSMDPYTGEPIFFETYGTQMSGYTYRTWHWTMTEQTSFEYLIFANSSWFNKWYLWQEMYLVDVEIGTKCNLIPEPSSSLALAGMLGGIGGLFLRRRK
jgi:hypothetical protein